ncbi:hypothetical protein LC609_31395 [Nostoc sp. XA013]|nr:hypothetical protein [Nostoc sp. XA013]
MMMIRSPHPNQAGKSTKQQYIGYSKAAPSTTALSTGIRDFEQMPWLATRYAILNELLVSNTFLRSIQTTYQKKYLYVYI